MRRTASSTSFVERERQRLEVADDLVDVFDDAGDGLVLVHDAVDAEAPHGGAAQRREQHATHRVAERVSEAALERLEAELGDVWIVLALRRFDELRTDESAEIDCVVPLFRNSSRSYRPTRWPATPCPAPTRAVGSYRELRSRPSSRSSCSESTVVELATANPQLALELSARLPGT